jgi:tetratricopeptide (TPR) repeat protein
MIGCRFLGVFIGVVAFNANSIAQAQQGPIHAETGGVAVGGNVRDSKIIIGVPAERIDELVRERTKPLEDLSASQQETIVLLKEKLDLNERQIRAALDSVGERNIPPERLAAKLIEIAQKFNDLKSVSAAQPGDDAEIEVLRQQVQAAISSGDLVRADSALAQIEMKQRAALGRLASNAAATVGRRGEVALARLHYLDAAKQFAEAARLLPQTDDFSKQQSKCLDAEASALYRQGEEFGDNAALVSAIDRYRTLLLLRPRDRVPLDWAGTQMNLGVALETLGERVGAGKLTEAVAAYARAYTPPARRESPRPPP